MSIELTHILAWGIFLISYGVFAIGRLPGTRVDRAGMAFIGAAAEHRKRRLSRSEELRAEPQFTRAD